MTIILIDGDTIGYRCAASCEPTRTKSIREPLDVAIQRADELMYRICEETSSDEFRLFISGGGNFRKILFPEYKANRIHEKPHWLEDVRNFLVSEWKAEVVRGYEADDAIAMAVGQDTVVCANDKDFLQLPGKHYNFVKQEHLTVSPYDAALNFWCQMLIGDSTDNVRGVDGIGKAKAPRYLAEVSPEEMEEIVRDLYQDDDRFELNKSLLWLLRSEEEYKAIQQRIVDRSTLS